MFRASVAFLLMLCAVPAEAQHPSTKKVGLIAPLTGPVGPHGRAVLDGLKLGLDAGGCAANVTLAVEDDGYDPKRSVTAARRLLSERGSELILSVGSGPSHAIAPLTDQANVPFLTLAADPKIASAHKTAIRARPSAAFEGSMVAKLATKSGATAVALVCTANDYTLGVCAAIARDLGDKVIVRQEVLPEEADFRTIVTKIRQSRPSHIIPILMPGKVGLFARQVREAKIDVPLIGGAYFESSTDVENSAGAMVGGTYVMVDVDASFRAKYEALPSASPGAIGWSAVYYDIGRIICLAGDTPLPEFLKSIKSFAGAAGPTTYTEEAGDRFLFHPLIQKQITSAGFVNLQ